MELILPVKCRCCGTVKNVIVTPEEYEGLSLWLEGKGHIQTLVPTMSAENRELFISKTCSDCWRNMFGGDDDE